MGGGEARANGCTDGMGSKRDADIERHVDKCAAGVILLHTATLQALPPCPSLPSNLLCFGCPRMGTPSSGSGARLSPASPRCVRYSQ